MSNEKELKAMEEDVKKAVGKEKEDLVAKTIAETKERLAKEAEAEELKQQIADLQKAREEDAKKQEERDSKMREDFKVEQEKLIKEFQDSRKSTVNNNNPFNNNQTATTEVSPLEKYKNDPAFAKEVDDESRKAAYEYWGKR